MQASNPFQFKHVQHLTGSLDDSGPCVVMATPSMLQVRLFVKDCCGFWKFTEFWSGMILD